MKVAAGEVGRIRPRSDRLDGEMGVGASCSPFVPPDALRTENGRPCRGVVAAR
jgi:hypothetical protein